jgi:hypothetical protein
MVVGVELRYFGTGLENGRFLNPTYCRKSRGKFAWLGRTYESCNHDKRATPIVREENKVLKLEILFNSPQSQGHY